MTDGITNKKAMWNYETAVKTGKHLVNDLKRNTLEIVRQLHMAREQLWNHGFRRDISAGQTNELENFVPNGTKLNTFEDYINDIGLPKRTAYNWLKLYLPDEDRMLTSEELRKQIEDQYQDGKRQILAHAGDPDWRPDNWPRAFESRYQEETRLQLAIQKEYASEFGGAQMWLFDEPYLRRLSERVAGYNEDLIEYRSFCERVEPTACPDVPVQKQVNVYKLVKAAVEDFAPAVRRDVARFVAQTLLRDASGEFDE